MMPIGTYLRLFEESLKGMWMFEKCIKRMVDGRLNPVLTGGLHFPYNLMAPYVIRVQKRGMDERALINRQKDTHSERTPSDDSSDDPEYWGMV